MSADRATLHLLPPPGPLCWLHPELGALQADRAGAQRSVEPVSCVPATLARLARRPVQLLVVPAGPRGQRLASSLRQHLRDRERPIEVTIDDQWESLESRLGRAAEQLPPGRTLLLGREAGTFSPQGLPLSKEGIRAASAHLEQDRDACWTLPLRPGPDLVETLAQAVRELALDPTSWAGAGLIPFFTSAATDSGSAQGPVDTRLAPGWWGVLPGDRYDARLRGLTRRLVRLLQPERYINFLAHENHALAGADLYGDVIDGRWMQPAATRGQRSEVRAYPAVVVGICGIDGSGKSSHVAELEAWLAGRGLRTAVHKIYRHGIFHDTITDLTRQCAADRNLHLWRIQRLVKVFDSVKVFFSAVEPDLERCDVVIFDRYVHTHLAAGSGRYHYDPYAREILSVFPRADRVFLLDAPVSRSLDRIGARVERTVDENPYMLGRYRDTLLGMAARHQLVLLDATRPMEHNRAVIRAEVEQAIRERQAVS